MRTTADVLFALRDFYREQWQKLMQKENPHVNGYLKIEQRNNHFRYYHGFYDPTIKAQKRIYLSRHDTTLIRQLAQKSYDQKLKRLLEKRLRTLDRICRDFHDEELENLYSSLSPQRKKLITPSIPSWEALVKQWIEKPYPVEPPSFPRPEIYSKNGEQLRSKSEKILADMFYDQNIPYKYECPLWLEQTWYYPDFTFLSPYTKKEVYWEHLGMMGEEEYASRAIQKILFYDRHGIYPGENLILTYETGATPLDFRWAQRLISRYLIKTE
ncbi:hypothetical protein K5I04_07160 [Murdochiella sp. Marseille-P8839]|nr:hypothetical protein [Murdochiella sp. Marseille-P8839]